MLARRDDALVRLPPASRQRSPDGAAHLARVAGGMLLLVAPGVFALRSLVARRDAYEVLTLAPAIGLGLTVAIAFLVLAVARSPLSQALAWSSVGLALALSVAPELLRRAAPRLGMGDAR